MACLLPVSVCGTLPGQQQRRMPSTRGPCLHVAALACTLHMVVYQCACCRFSAPPLMHCWEHAMPAVCSIVNNHRADASSACRMQPHGSSQATAAAAAAAAMCAKLVNLCVARGWKVCSCLGEAVAYAASARLGRSQLPQDHPRSGGSVAPCHRLLLAIADVADVVAINGSIIKATGSVRRHSAATPTHTYLWWQSKLGFSWV